LLGGGTGAVAAAAEQKDPRDSEQPQPSGAESGEPAPQPSTAPSRQPARPRPSASQATQEGGASRPSSTAQAPPTQPPPAAAPPTPAPEPVLPLSPDQIAGHLGETADWFHHLAALQVPGADSASKDRLHQQALTAVELAVEFGRACARLLSAQSQQASTSAASASTSASDTGSTKGLGGRLDQAA